MKLILCKNCEDIVRLTSDKRSCACGLAWGRYTDQVNAEINDNATPLGFANSSFVNAIMNRPKGGNSGAEFTAFVIQEDCPTIKVIKDSGNDDP